MSTWILAAAISAQASIADLGIRPSTFATLLDPAVRALLVAAAVWTGLRLMRARNVVAQKAAWGMVLAGSMLMPLAAPWAANAAWLPARAKLVLPLRAWFHALIVSRAEPKSSANATAFSNGIVPAPGANGEAPLVLPPADMATTPAASSQADRFPAPSVSNSYGAQAAGNQQSPKPAQRHIFSLAASAWMLYAVVCTALMLRLVYGLGAAADLWWSSQPIHIAPRIANGLKLRSSRAVSSPVTVGSGILLPADYDEWDEEKLRIVLAHERSHVHQGDFYLQALAGLYAALFWFSPLGWWLKRKLSDLSEAISDRAGLMEATSRASYAQILLEFAALPRPTQIGVAMARTGRISHRIERLLNENLFGQAFTGSRRRLWAALLMVPATLFAATALVRVEAAQTQPAPAAPASGQSHPESAPETAAPAPTAAELPAPAAPAAADAVTQSGTPQTPEPPPPATPAAAPVAPTGAVPVAPVAPVAPLPDVVDTEDADSSAIVTSSNGSSVVTMSGSHSGRGRNYARGYGHGYSYSYDSDGESYALVTGNGSHLSGSGAFNSLSSTSIDKARTKVHGDFLWFTHNGKSYVVDDPQTIAQIQGMYKPMEELGRQQEELGRRQEALGRQQEELGRRQEQASVPTPDISHEMADLNAAMAKLQAKKGSTVTQNELADLEGKLGQLQGRLGRLQGEVGSKQGEFGRQQGELGAKQGELGAQQGRLGAEQGRLGREADIKVKGIIDESLKNGKAKPVE
ncbi:MAG TPA: M56 family metallopeptidase [Terracidiphilus sp.]|jgi:beta-lactamase regulating signal transducer with metallopeptidase domain